MIHFKQVYLKTDPGTFAQPIHHDPVVNVLFEQGRKLL